MQHCYIRVRESVMCVCWKIVCYEINLTVVRLKSAVVSALWTAFSAACRSPCTLHSVTLVLPPALRHICTALCTPSHLYCTLHIVTLVLHSALRHTCIALCTLSHLYCTLHSMTLVLHSALRHTCIALCTPSHLYCTDTRGPVSHLHNVWLALWA